MNIGTSVIFSDMNERKDIPDEFRPILNELARRLDVAFSEVLSGLKNEPTVFTVDPDDDDNADIIQGAKPGDLAVYVDGTGAVQVHVFD